MQKINLLNNQLVSHIKPTIKAILPQKLKLIILKIIEKDTRERIYFNNKLVVIDKSGTIEGAVSLLYWDAEPNFGDVIGPYLVSKITNLPTVNVLHRSTTSCLMTVGSIIQRIDREGMVIWGSGLIQEPSYKELLKISKYKPKVLSVRGFKTAELLESIGIEIINKNAYGDPALIMPLFYQPTSINPVKTAICPHFTHKEYFINEVGSNEFINIIDVQADMQFVVDQIASSSACISTSLHGIIIAQAYNIPWIWLEITDNNLKGNDFKFLDFFSTIDKSMITHVKIKLSDIANIDFKELANKASLPRKFYNEKLILDALKQHIDSIEELSLSYLPKK